MARSELSEPVLAESTSVDPADYLARFNLERFRPGQREVIDAVLSGQDCLCIMPTGGGKSLCFQLPSLMRQGVTLVVSPLIALMKDQVDALQAKGIRADYINSHLTLEEQHLRLTQLDHNEFDLLYVAPERFRSQRFVEILRRSPPQLLAIDEAHCISEWGHDFRHDYARLGQYRQRIGQPQTIALTATATPDVQVDICKQLRLTTHRTFIAGFARDNLYYEGQACATVEKKMEALFQLLRSTPGAGIIYASTRKSCESLAAQLSGVAGRTLGVYHAGMESHDRKAVQEGFMEGELDVVVATNAFGMGIDKADVRFVAHFNIPGSIEAYYQEAGRAGRDGLAARCVLLHDRKDEHIQRFFIESAYPDVDVIRQVYEYLQAQTDDPIQITQKDLKNALGLSISSEGVGTCERVLERAGVIERMEPHRNMGVVRINSDMPSLVDFLPRTSKTRRRVLVHAQEQIGEVRFEPVYFNPLVWASDLQMPVATITRALRELTELEAFDFVPQFRGRAIHVTRRGVAFDDLNLDLESMEKRKALDYAKLHRMVDYANARRCRQNEILKYFGEQVQAACEHCDNCHVKRRGFQHTVTRAVLSEHPAMLETVRMILSGVARAGERFGKQLIAAMLCGSRSSKVNKWGLQQLSTFGLLAHLQQVEVAKMIEALLEAGLIEQTEVDRFRPIVKLTKRGIQVMKGDAVENVSITVDEEPLRKIERRFSQAADPHPSGHRIADRPIKVPCDALNPSSAGWTAEAAEALDYAWTVRVMRQGFSLDECCQIRRLDRGTVVNHLRLASAAGEAIPPEWVFSPAQLQELRQAVQAATDLSSEAILSQLSESFAQADVLIFLKGHAAPPRDPLVDKPSAREPFAHADTEWSD